MSGSRVNINQFKRNLPESRATHRKIIMSFMNKEKEGSRSTTLHVDHFVKNAAKPSTTIVALRFSKCTLLSEIN